MIDPQRFLIYFALGAAGAASLELLKLYEYRGKLPQKKYHQEVRSVFFWAVVVGMLAASGFIAGAFHVKVENQDPWFVVLTGIGARSVIRGGVAAKVANSQEKLGAEEDAVTLRDIFL